MNQQIYLNQYSVIVQIVTALISLGVGCVVYWYTKETQRLRLQTEVQVRLFRHQILMGLAPYISALVSAKRPEVCKCGLQNPTDHAAVNLSLYVRASGNFYRSALGINLLPQTRLENPWEIEATGPVEWNVLTDHMNHEYGNAGERYAALLKSEPRDYIAVLFQDVRGNVYAALRTVQFEGNAAVSHWANRLIYPENFLASD